MDPNTVLPATAVISPLTSSGIVWTVMGHVAARRRPVHAGNVDDQGTGGCG